APEQPRSRTRWRSQGCWERKWWKQSDRASRLLSGSPTGRAGDPWIGLPRPNKARISSSLWGPAHEIDQQTSQSGCSIRGNLQIDFPMSGGENNSNHDRVQTLYDERPKALPVI